MILVKKKRSIKRGIGREIKSWKASFKMMTWERVWIKRPTLKALERKTLGRRKTRTLMFLVEAPTSRAHSKTDPIAMTICIRKRTSIKRTRKNDNRVRRKRSRTVRMKKSRSRRRLKWWKKSPSR